MKPRNGGSFTIEFPVHVPAERREYYLRAFQTEGAQIEAESPDRFHVVCATQRQVREIGRWLFQTAFKNWGRVIAASDGVSLESSAYPFPRTRAERKGGR